MVMKRQGVMLTLALVLAAHAAGCSSYLSCAARNVTELPIQSCDEVKLRWRNRCRADEAWEQVRRGFGEESWTKDYAAGFKDGYADYLTNGGNGEPPATPPFCYRLRPYQTPDGLRAIEDWYAGFRHGSALGRASGFRETLVIPLSAPPINAVDRYPVLDLPTPLPGPAPELLNQPKKVAQLK
jgi:hypothetical protein